MKFTLEDIEKVILIQANIRGFLVRQEIRRQLLEIYEYEKEQLEYLQGRKYNNGGSDYYNHDYQDDFIELNGNDPALQYGRHSVKEEIEREGKRSQREETKKDANKSEEFESDDNIEFHQSNESSSVEIEKKVQEKYIQQQLLMKGKQSAQEYQLHQLDLNKQKAYSTPKEAFKQTNGLCLLAGKKDESLKFPQINPIFTNSQMKHMMDHRDSQDEIVFQENSAENKEKLKKIEQKLKQEEKEDLNLTSPDNFKVKFYSQSANILRSHFDEDDEDEIREKEDRLRYQQCEEEDDEEQRKENINFRKQKANDSESSKQSQYEPDEYKENHHNKGYLNQESVIISVEISESNLLTEKRKQLLQISNHHNQLNQQKNGGKQSTNNNNTNNNNNIYNQNYQLKNNNKNNQHTTTNKANQNRFYQDDDDDSYNINEQINLYTQTQRHFQDNQQANVKQNQNGVNKKFDNVIQVVDQFNFSPHSGSSNSNQQKGTHFAKISNIEYRSYPGDNFLFEESQTYEIYQRREGDYYHHEHHPQQASYSEPQDNNELILNKSVFVKNMGVIRQMQEDQKTVDTNTRSLNHEKNMKKIRKMIHQNQILNNKNRKNFLQLSRYSLESFQDISQREEDILFIRESQNNLLETTQQQQHNNGQIFDAAVMSNENSMMSSRVQESSKMIVKKMKSNDNKLKQSAQSTTSINSNNQKYNSQRPIMFDFDIYILAATKIQKVFKGYLSRKFIVEYQKVKKATLIIEAQYLKFKQFLVKKMKDCTYQIECSSYNIIKLVQDFEKGEKFLKSQFRKKNFDQKIKVNRDKLCKVFIQFINNYSDKLEDGKHMTTEQENLLLQREIIKLKQVILSQHKSYKSELDCMQQKYEELRSLHKETIKKYINGIQNLSAKKKGSQLDITTSNLQESQQQSAISEQKPNQQKTTNNPQSLLKLYKENDKDINNQIQASNSRKDQAYQYRHAIKDEQKENRNDKRHGNSADTKRTSQKSPDRGYIQKQFDALKYEAEKDLENFESQIKKIKFDHGNQKSPSPPPHNSHKDSRKTEERRQLQNSKGKEKGSDHSIEKNKQFIKKTQKQPNGYNFDQSLNSIHQQYMSDEFINFSKFSMNSSSKK